MKYKNKYRIESSRLTGWDYSSPGKYFITINIRDHRCLFGEVDNGLVKLSHVGVWANKLWLEIPEHFSNVHYGAFVVMPNHLHGIVVIEKQDDGPEKIGSINNLNSGQNVETRHASSLIRHASSLRITPPPGSLSVILGSYKSSVTRNVRKYMPGFEWQSRFYDHIIRDIIEYQFISEYITNNPKNWENDKLFAK